MDLTKTLESYLNELSSEAPTPGGGNVSAFCGVLASALGQMVCSLTVGKKKYADVEEEIKDIRDELTDLKDEFLPLAKQDNDAFDKVMAAFKLPKETDEQKNKRREAIDSATMEAAVVPSEVILKCRKLIPLLKTVAEKGNRNSVSDAGVAIALTSAAAQGAFLNVAINCSGLINQVAAEEFLKKFEILFREIKSNADYLTESILKEMRKSP